MVSVLKDISDAEKLSCDGQGRLPSVSHCFIFSFQLPDTSNLYIWD